MTQSKRPAETDLIQKWLRPLAGPAGLGLADDVACHSPARDHDLVLTVDTIVAGTHFLNDDDPADIAIKAITVNQSDVVAKGASLVGYLVAISFPQKPTENWMASFSKGLGKLANGRILGGDMTVGKGPLTISVTAIGEVPTGRMVQRSGANVGDALYVSGVIGLNWCGLQSLTDAKWKKAAALTDAEMSALAKAYRAPEVVNAEETASLIRDYASASMDVSDGLAIDLDRLCEASRVGAVVELESIPLDGIVKRLLAREIVSWPQIVTGGDDYVSLFSVPEHQIVAFEASKADNIVRIGTLQAKENGVVWQHSVFGMMDIGARKGYDHFS